MRFNEKQKRKVEERGYIYIGTYERNEKFNAVLKKWSETSHF